MLMDANTPIMKELLMVILKLEGTEYLDNQENTEPMRSWFEQYDLCDQYPNLYEDWMMTFVQTDMPTFDYNYYVDWLSQVKNLNELLYSPCFAEPTPAVNKSDVPLVIDEDIIPPKNSVHPKRSKLFKRGGRGKGGKGKIANC
jgi:hypothetical protein